MSLRYRHLGFALILFTSAHSYSSNDAEFPPMLDLPGIGTETDKMVFKLLPVLNGEHGRVSEGKSPWLFRLHSYLAYHNDKYWCMWSHGPIVEDKPSQHVRYATSDDGLHWDSEKFIAGPPEDKGERYISRGFWQRDGKLIALATLDGALPKENTPWSSDLRLLGFEWDDEGFYWKEPVTIFPDTLSNFPPELLANGKWMGLYRDNSNSMRLRRAVSTDLGRSWSRPEKTNLPDATSKFFGMRTSRGFYVLVSNANPITNASPLGRNPLCLSLSEDGVTFTRMARLPIPISPNGGPYDTEHVSF